MVSWQFLLLGTVGAVGAAMALGTIAALASYRRTGLFPGQDDPADTPTRGQVVALYGRIAVGVALAAVGVFALRDLDLL